MLTRKASQDYRLGILHIDFGRKRDDLDNISMREKLKKSYYIILCMIAFQQSQLENKSDFEAQYIFNLMALKPTDSNSSNQNKTIHGVTINELTSKLSGIFGYWHIILNNYIVRKALSYLEKEGLVEGKVLGTKSYYILTNSIFKDFVLDCTEFYWDIQFRLRIMWQTIRPPKPHERTFYNLFYEGDINKSIEYFKNLLKKKKLDPNYKAIVKQNKDILDTLDNGLNEHYRMIERNYSKLFEKYPSLVSIVLDIFYPPFLRDEIANIDKKYSARDKNGKILKNRDRGHRYKKYPKIERSYGLDYI